MGCRPGGDCPGQSTEPTDSTTEQDPQSGVGIFQGRGGRGGYLTVTQGLRAAIHSGGPGMPDNLQHSAQFTEKKGPVSHMPWRLKPCF